MKMEKRLKDIKLKNIMEAKNFVDSLKKMLPSSEYLYANYELDYIEQRIKKRFMMPLKNTLPSTNNPIIDLINNYNILFLSFSDYSFLEEIEEIDGIQVFCQSSGTYLGFKNSDSKIIEYDRDDNNLIDYCADNAEAFLKAVLVLSKHYADIVDGKIDRKDKSVNKEYIQLCCEAAGSIKYEAFYKGIIR